MKERVGRRKKKRKTRTLASAGIVLCEGVKHIQSTPKGLNVTVQDSSPTGKAESTSHKKGGQWRRRFACSFFVERISRIRGTPAGLNTILSDS